MYARTTRHLILFATLALATVPGVGCAHGSYTDGANAFTSASRAESARSEVVSLKINNQYTSDVKLYVMRSGTRVPIGRIGSFHSKTISIPRALIGRGRYTYLVARPLAHNHDVAVAEVLVKAGQEVVWNITTNPTFSSFWVR